MVVGKPCKLELRERYDEIRPREESGRERVDSISGMMRAAASIQAVRSLDTDLVDEVSGGMVDGVPLCGDFEISV